MNKRKILETCQEYVQKLDATQLKALVIVLEGLQAGKAMRTAIEEAAAFLRSNPGYEDDAQLWISALEEWEEQTA